MPEKITNELKSALSSLFAQSTVAAKGGAPERGVATLPTTPPGGLDGAGGKGSDLTVFGSSVCSFGVEAQW